MSIVNYIIDKCQDSFLIKLWVFLIFFLPAMQVFSSDFKSWDNYKNILYPFDSTILSEKKEYQIKARFIFRFIDFVDWGDSLKAGKFNIVILGSSPIVKELKTEVRKKENRKDVKVAEVSSLKEIDKCQIIFISKENKISLNDIISKFGSSPVLIVSEQNGYAARGTHINFFISDRKVKFEVNLEALKRSGLKVSSQLLKHAVILG